jgi:hypothetical protein
MTYHARRDDIEDVVDMIKYYLDNNPDVKAVSLFSLHEHISEHVKRHEWEQALHRLNLQGVVSKPIHGKTYCCGRCRADIWYVNKT